MCSDVYDDVTKKNLHILKTKHFSSNEIIHSLYIQGYMSNIFNSFLALLWKMETSSRPFYEIDEMAIEYDVLISSRWSLWIPYKIYLVKNWIPYKKLSFKKNHWKL